MFVDQTQAAKFEPYSMACLCVVAAWSRAIVQLSKYPKHAAGGAPFGFRPVFVPAHCTAFGPVTFLFCGG